MTNSAPKFPLPLAHCFGLDPNDITVHDGSKLMDQQALIAWQRRYRNAWNSDGVVTGAFDGPTQRACIDVQRRLGLVITAVLDQATWDAVWAPTEDAEKPAESPVEAPAGPALTEDQGPPVVAQAQPVKPTRVGSASKAQKSAANKIVWRHRADGEMPRWMDNPEFDREQVARIKLGISADEDLAERLKGLQLIAGIEQTGSLDAATAWLLEERAPGTLAL